MANGAWTVCGAIPAMIGSMAEV
ncbi:hypothetical protein RB2654_14080 [Rhodobacterales bacterium HTCC2654]|uniref:Uncharacterized protein n=1 Tax=Maritimibacter alkaliphilus HTCC2654 TaxID=314271 RepID=A3VGL5_9RHOB|nr:hypothetical protein RB2654_14080 [Rhodobacterales bacterium HTCC2654] [Maritimibacter alkaliphilus HTCC2654]